MNCRTISSCAPTYYRPQALWDLAHPPFLCSALFCKPTTSLRKSCNLQPRTLLPPLLLSIPRGWPDTSIGQCERKFRTKLTRTRAASTNLQCHRIDRRYLGKTSTKKSKSPLVMFDTFWYQTRRMYCAVRSEKALLIASEFYPRFQIRGRWSDAGTCVLDYPGTVYLQVGSPRVSCQNPRPRRRVPTRVLLQYCLLWKQERDPSHRAWCPRGAGRMAYQDSDICRR